MAGFRALQTIWNNVATGGSGFSALAVIGADSFVGIFITVSGATTISVLVHPGTGAPGINALPTSSGFIPLYKNDGSGALTVTFAGAGSACLNLSPFAPQFVMLQSSNNITATAYVDSATSA